MDEWIVTDLPDVTGMTLSELLDSDDPELRTAIDRLVESIQTRPDADGCGC